MFIGLKEIQTIFANNSCSLIQTNETYCLFNWTKLETALIPYSLHTLYVCEYTENLKKTLFIQDMHILCIIKKGGSPEKLISEFPPYVNILFIRSDSPKRIYTTLSDYFSTQCGIGMFAETLSGILSSEKGIQEMVNYSYRVFNNPVFVFDAGFNLIAANWEAAKKTDSGLSLIENKGFSKREFEMANSRDHIHDKVRKSKTPIAAYNPDIGYDQLLCAISTKKDLGHIVLTAINRPLHPSDNELLLILKKCIYQQLKNDEFTRNAKGFHYEYFLKDLLDRKIATAKPFRDRLDYVDKEFSGHMYCLVIETARSSSALNTYFIRNLFEANFPNSKTMMYSGQIIGIISFQDHLEVPQGLLDSAIKICKENGLYGGLSNCFENILALYEYYKQALHAIELGVCSADKPNLFLYQDYFLEHMANIFTQKESSQIYCHPKMKLLLDYDKKHHSELSYTLYMYLIHERNIAVTAAAMHMHRNSLVYRINKINTLIGIDYDSYRERQYLIFSYELNKPDT